MNRSFFRRDSLRAASLLLTSLIIVMLPSTARVAKGLDAIANWPDLKALLHSEADKHPVRLSRGSSIILDASKGVLAPDLSLLQVLPVNDLTVAVPANGVLTFAVDVAEPMYVTGSVSIAAEAADLRPGLRAYVLSDTTVVAAPMIYQEVPAGQTQIDFDFPGEMPDKMVPLVRWRLRAGRHYISIAGPHYRAAGVFESLELHGLATVPQRPEHAFALIADAHLGNVGASYKSWSPHRGGASALQLGNTLKALRQEGISFAILAGDMTDTSADGQFQQLGKVIASSGGLEVYGCIGNHDAYVSAARPTALAVPGLFPGGKTNYVLNKAPLRFIVVDAAYWLTSEGKWVDYFDRSIYAGIGMRPEDRQWLIDTLAADTSTPTVVVSHFPFQVSAGKTQCGYVLSAEQGDLQDIIKAAPNVIATLNGHKHCNHVETYQNNFGDDIVSIIAPSLVEWPAGYKVIRVYSDGSAVHLEWETRLVDNMGYVATSAPQLSSSPSLSWRISTGDDLAGEIGLSKERSTKVRAAGR